MYLVDMAKKTLSHVTGLTAKLLAPVYMTCASVNQWHWVDILHSNSTYQGYWMTGLDT